MIRDGALAVYPADENETALRRMISGMLESGILDPAGLAEEARRNGETAKWFLCSAIMVLLVQRLWTTQLYRPETEPGEELRTAVRKSVSVMFVVNTATLVGGVGATALIFTLGANSLIADVLAGIFIIFEGDFTVGDVVVIDGFRGIVTDIGMRTTKLMDDNTRDIRIINNSTIKTLTNQSRENSSVIIDMTAGSRTRKC